MLVLSLENLLMSRENAIYPVGYLTFPLPLSVTSGTSLIPCIWYCFDSLLFLCFMLFLLMHLMLYFLNVIVTSAIFFFCWNFLLILAAPRHSVTRLLATTRTSVPLFITSSSKFQTTRFYSCTKKVQIRTACKGTGNYSTSSKKVKAPVVRSKERKESKLNPWWVTGFVDGEGYWPFLLFKIKIRMLVDT